MGGGFSPADISLVEHTLTLSYEERIEAHEAAHQLMRDLQKAGQDYYARQSQSPAFYSNQGDNDPSER